MNVTESNTPKLVADVVVIAAGQTLLVRYNDLRRYDGQQGWFLPNDTVAYGEHPSDAAKRILLEQVGLKIDEVTLSYIASFVTEDGGRWNLVFHHKLELDNRPDITTLFNLKSAQWFPLEALPQAEEVAHRGWAIDIIREMMKKSEAAATPLHTEKTRQGD
jgi:ADP-ribose pyrophosphatase YjhB (NUDIX family)